MQARHRHRLVALGIAGTTVTATALTGPAFAATDPPSTTRVSVGKRSVQADAASTVESMSPNGRYIVFRSTATNLVPGDTNGNDEFYLKDTKTKVIRKISIARGGGELNGAISNADVSANGRYVAFESSASNLVARDENGTSDVFVRDMKTGVNTRASVGRSGAPTSGGGRSPSISDDGRLVAFDSFKSDLVRKDTNENGDIFVRDLKTRVTTRVSVGPRGIQSDPPVPVPPPPYGGERYSYGAVISGDGRSVAFTSFARNLVLNDTNDTGDVFLHTLKTHKTQRVSLATGGVESQGGYKGFGSSNPSISANGAVIAFGSFADNLVDGPRLHPSDSYVYNLKTRVTTRVEATLDGSPSEGGAGAVSVSPDGRYVSFTSADSNVVAGDANGTADVFVRDLKTGKFRLASVDSAGHQSNGYSLDSKISSGGKLVAFWSEATNLVSGDTNGVADVFVHKF